jgi:hypothetical protein
MPENTKKESIIEKFLENSDAQFLLRKTRYFYADTHKLQNIKYMSRVWMTTDRVWIGNYIK